MVSGFLEGGLWWKSSLSVIIHVTLASPCWLGSNTICLWPSLVSSFPYFFSHLEFSDVRLFSQDTVCLTGPKAFSYYWVNKLKLGLWMEKRKRVVWKWGSDPASEGSSGKDRGLGHGEKG